MSLTRGERYTHVHLDWQPPEAWLGHQPFRLLLQGRRAVAALACMTDVPDTAWLRLFAVMDGFSRKQAWEWLWLEAHSELRRAGVPHVAVMCAHSAWLPPLLEAAGFAHTRDVILLRRPAEELPAAPPSLFPLRPARPDDVDWLTHLDHLSFAPPWQLSRAAMQQALGQAAIASVVEIPPGEPGAGGLIGYQISTASLVTGHLARLGVHPAWQGRGLGRALTFDALARFEQMRLSQATVNTQADNVASTAVYQSLGFRPSHERYPVYQLPAG